MNKDTKDLFDKSNSVEFYNDRYNQGYMEDWPSKKKERIKLIIQKMKLPATGNALDYGCGNGVFTVIVKEALPHWNIYGSDISQVAVQNASHRFKNCTFYTAGDKGFKDLKFDFIFSHHVLEHVYDIDKSCEEIALLANPGASLLHILPCGNEGSMEYFLSSIRNDGIDKQMNNRFFYEDAGHLRRLKSQELADIYMKYNFQLTDAYFANQYYGAFEWITNFDSGFIIYITNAKNINSLSDKVKITWLQKKLLFLYKAKNIVSYYKDFDRNNLSFFNKLKFFVAEHVSQFYIKRSDLEWENSSKKKNGSEMFVCLKKNN